MLRGAGGQHTHTSNRSTLCQRLCTSELGIKGTLQTLALRSAPWEKYTANSACGKGPSRAGQEQYLPSAWELRSGLALLQGTSCLLRCGATHHRCPADLLPLGAPPCWLRACPFSHLTWLRPCLMAAITCFVSLAGCHLCVLSGPGVSGPHTPCETLTHLRAGSV